MSSRSVRAASLGPLALSALASCSLIDAIGGRDDPGAGGGSSVIAAEVAVRPDTKLDVLFVIDNSADMDMEQDALIQGFPNFVLQLDGIGGGLPDVHIGVISSDVGVGYSLINCEGDGDRGDLQSSARGACTPPAGAFISDEIDGMGGRIRNYTDSLDATFGCIARLGTDGCGFEQPLESIRRALDSNTVNTGFLREDAHLLIVLLSDEDDCSAQDSIVFDPNYTELGALTSFRCTEYGVTCNGEPIGREPASYSNCSDRDDSFLYGTWYLADFLRGIKDQRLIHVAGIFGNQYPFDVATNDLNQPNLLPSCQSSLGFAAPGIRLQSFVDEFGTHGVSQSICDDELGFTMDRIGRYMRGALGPNPCLMGNLDVDPSTSELELDCAAYFSSDGTPDLIGNISLPLCDETHGPDCILLPCGKPPCVAYDGDGLCPGVGLSVNVDLGGLPATPPDTAKIFVSCRTPPE